MRPSLPRCFVSGLLAQHQALLTRPDAFCRECHCRRRGDGRKHYLGNLIGTRRRPLLGLVRHLMLSQNAANLVLVWWLCPWAPESPNARRRRALALTFGGNVTAEPCSTTSALLADRVIIGRSGAALPLGLYDRSAPPWCLCRWLQINPPLAAVALPALSRAPEDSRALRPRLCFYPRQLALVTAVLVPILIVNASR